MRPHSDSRGCTTVCFVCFVNSVLVLPAPARGSSAVPIRRTRTRCCLASSLVPWLCPITTLVFQYEPANLIDPVEAVWQEEGGPAALSVRWIAFLFSCFFFLLSSPPPWMGHEVWLGGRPIDWMHRRSGR